MSVKFQDNTSEVGARIRQQASVALRMLGEDVFRRSDPRTPKRKGHLRQDKLIQVLGLKATLVWLKQYAAIQEDVQHRRYTTPGTGPHFAENAVREAVGKAEQTFRKARLI